jgi:hypothetical protein
MSNSTSNFGPDSFLISTVLEFGGREFEVIVGHDGRSYWFDPIAKRRELENDPMFVMKIIMGDKDRRKRYENIKDEYTLDGPIPDDGLRIIREELSPAYWSDDTSNDFDDRLDAILIPIFWEHINPFLSPSIEK